MAAYYIRCFLLHKNIIIGGNFNERNKEDKQEI